MRRHACAINLGISDTVRRNRWENKLCERRGVSSQRQDSFMPFAGRWSWRQPRFIRAGENHTGGKLTHGCGVDRLVGSLWGTNDAVESLAPSLGLFREFIVLHAFCIFKHIHFSTQVTQTIIKKKSVHTSKMPAYLALCLQPLTAVSAGCLNGPSTRLNGTG